VELVIAEIEDGNLLAGAGLLRAVSLIEQRGVAAVGAERNRRGKAVGAGEVSGDGECQGFAGGKIDAARAIGGAGDEQDGKERRKSQESDEDSSSWQFFHGSGLLRF